MDKLQRKDPFLWDVDTVVKNICVPGCAWTRNSTALATKVREEEIDGKTLLTYEHLCSRQELMECLGIKVARHKAALSEAIHDIRYASQLYQSWLKGYKKKEEGLHEETDSIGATAQNLLFPQESATSNGTTQDRQVNGLSTAHQDPVTGVVSQGRIHDIDMTPPATASQILQPKNPPETSHLEASTQLGEIASIPTNSAPSPPNLSSDHQPQSSHDEDRATKRRRIVPVNLTSTPFNASPIPIPTEADVVTGLNNRVLHKGTKAGFPWESSAPHAYLGVGSLSIAAIKSSSGSTSSQLVRIDEDQFTVNANKSIPPGRRLAVYHAMKQHFKENSRKEVLLNQGLAVQSVISSEDGDSILDLSDLPDEFDEQTLREIEAERVDVERSERLQLERFLTRERVKTILDEAVASFSSTWETVKLPKYQRRAYKIWHGAARHGTRKIQILKARREAELYDHRIKKLYAGIMDEKWSREAEVRLQARSLEQSVEDKLYRLWLLELLESRVEPPKPSVIPRTTIPAVPRPTTPLSGEELLSSDEEEDFIVPDSPSGDGAAYDDIMLDYAPEPQDPIFSSPVKPKLSVQVDLTEFTPVKTSKAPRERIEIDLISPTKSSPRGNSPSVGFSSQPTHMKSIVPPQNLSAEECGAQTGSHWAKRKERWALVLCLLWRLTQARRSPILQLIKDNSPADVWDATIKRHLESPAKESELGDVSAAAATRAFDLTRIFFSFIRTRNCKESRIANLGEKYEMRLNAERDVFAPFCQFIAGMASQFPSDDQIYRADAVEDDLTGADVFDDDTPARSQNTPSKPRKTLVKEIVQNKEALDMREREKRRTEEQKARRATLRAKLAMSDAMPHDKSRLIINESKQEDQEFIYVNDEIGKRIKDHQIDGVRFLWNQIVLDPEFRQGCLLAHTMGLGKTMQVITLLVAIAEAVISPDPSTQEQIPECLRESKTLILCPAGLVDNWMDEILIWAPAGLLGDLRKIDSTMKEDSERFSVIRDWARRGGVLIIGYPMFQRVSSADDEIQSILAETPNIVVADEAHYLKAPDAKVTRACSQFQTMSRIALTGSPLANNVEEYHSMIDWVAPNFLGPLSEFREIYAHPIQQGLWIDSLGSEKRNALKMLQVLKETVAPKVHRATIKSCLKNDLPPKYEFVISVAATDIQQRLYKHYIEQVGQTGNKMPQAQLFGIVNDLNLICNHPRCFRQKLLDLQKDVKDKSVNFPMAAMPTFLKETRDPDLANASLSLKVELLMKVLDEARDIGDKVLVFSQSVLTIDYLMYVFQQQKRRVQRLDGKTPIGHRQDMIKDFNTGSHDVYVISTKAGGVGLNIQGANRVVIFDFKWNPVNDQQAIGRAYRIGQQKTVFVYRLIVGGTFEEDLQNKAVFKMQLASRVVDKKNPVSWSKRAGSLLHPIERRDVEDLSTFKGKDRILDTLISTQKPGSIRSIVSTDTFEEEDPAVDLTTEERREADNLVNMNRLRITDPKEYSRLKEQELREEAARLRQYIPSSVPQYLPGQAIPTAATVPPSRVLPSTQPAESRYGLDGAYDVPDLPNTQPMTRIEGFSVYSNPMTTTSSEAVSISASASAPLPMMAGANTFFRQKSPPPTQLQERRDAPQSGQSKPLSAFGGVFGNPREAAKEGFEKKLIDKLETLQGKLASTISGPLKSYAATIATSIDIIRKERAFGFLPDSQHWKLLTEFLSSDRLVHAMCVGVVTTQFLALTDRAELKRRVETLNKLAESEFQLLRRDNIGQPEPHNLRNIRRSSIKSPEARRNARGHEDMKVMREAADNRRLRAVQLPPWANRALSGGRSRETTEERGGEQQ